MLTCHAANCASICMSAAAKCAFSFSICASSRCRRSTKSCQWALMVLLMQDGVREGHSLKPALLCTRSAWESRHIVRLRTSRQYYRWLLVPGYGHSSCQPPDHFFCALPIDAQTHQPAIRVNDGPVEPILPDRHTRPPAYVPHNPSQMVLYHVVTERGSTRSAIRLSARCGGWNTWRRVSMVPCL